MTPRQQRFVEEYLIDLNGRQAAIRAGYSPNAANEQASRLLTKANIKAAVDAGKRERAEKAGISAEYVLTSLKSIAERCQQGVPVMVKGPDGELVESGEWKFDAAGANKALELLGKHLVLFTDKQEVNGGLTVNVVKFADEPTDEQGPSCEEQVKK